MSSDRGVSSDRNRDRDISSIQDWAEGWVVVEIETRALTAKKTET